MPASTAMLLPVACLLQNSNCHRSEVGFTWLQVDVRFPFCRPSIAAQPQQAKRMPALAELRTPLLPDLLPPTPRDSPRVHPQIHCRPLFASKRANDHM